MASHAGPLRPDVSRWVTVGYMFYDIGHYFMHHGHSQAEWFRKLRKHHMVHHSPKLEHEKKFGVSTTLWDHVFGSYAEE